MASVYKNELKRGKVLILSSSEYATILDALEMYAGSDVCCTQEQYDRAHAARKLMKELEESD